MAFYIPFLLFKHEAHHMFLTFPRHYRDQSIYLVVSIIWDNHIYSETWFFLFVIFLLSLLSLIDHKFVIRRLNTLGGRDGMLIDKFQLSFFASLPSPLFNWGPWPQAPGVENGISKNRREKIHAAVTFWSLQEVLICKKFFIYPNQFILSRFFKRNQR